MPKSETVFATQGKWDVWADAYKFVADFKNFRKSESGECDGDKSSFEECGVVFCVVGFLYFHNFFNLAYLLGFEFLKDFTFANVP